MSAVLGVLLLVALFLLFPLVKRERKSRGCTVGGCRKMRLGFGCGSCPLDTAAALDSDAGVDESPGG